MRLKSLPWLRLLVGVLCLTPCLPARAAEVRMSIPPGHYAHRLTDESLRDPSGKAYTRSTVIGQVGVALFSAPNLSQEKAQRQWAQALADDPATRLPKEVAFYLVEDMSQAGLFKGMARASMKKDFTPGSRPILILDETGGFTKKFGVPRGTTQILIYDRKATLRDVESDLSDLAATAARVRAICRRLAAE